MPSVLHRDGVISGQDSGKPSTTQKGKKEKNFLFRFLPMAANKTQMLLSFSLPYSLLSPLQPPGLSHS